ncbi:putative U3 small nucleolar RNA-associated protein 7 [Glugoides intestinalis]
MQKKEIKNTIKEFESAVKSNISQVKTLEVLNPQLPEYDELCYSQNYIQSNVNLYTKEKAFKIKLKDNLYRCTYTMNGSNMLISDNVGYLAAFNTQTLSTAFEVSLEDNIYDAKWLHNELYCATAQEDCVFIYSNNGSELHAVRDMKNTRLLEFLPYHFLLAGTSTNGFLNYLDTSIGTIASSIFIADKSPTVLKTSLKNGVVHVGAKNGQVSLWAPSQKSYLMKVKCHKASISGVEIDRSGIHMITTGSDNKVNVFDIRNTYKPLSTVSTKTNVHFTALSQKNLLAIGYSDKVTILKNYKDVYMKHRTSGIISSLEFCNNEDILSIGYTGGFSTIVVPGSGDPIYDSNENSPFITTKERRNLEVRKLLEKIPADMIGLNSVLRNMEKPSQSRKETPTDLVQKKPRDALTRFFE